MPGVIVPSGEDNLARWEKAIVAIIVLVVIGAAAFFLLVKPNSDDPRKEFARQVVDGLAAANWERSALKASYSLPRDLHPAANAKDFRRTVVLARVGPQ
jgi:hypothetical protein